MKTTLSILFFVVANKLGIIKATNDLEFPINGTCLNEYGIDPGRINNRTDERELTTREIYCSAACMYRDTKIMRPDGTIDVAEVEARTKDDPSEGKLFFAVVDACKEGRVACELVQCMFYQLKHHLGNHASDSSESVRDVFADKGLIDFISERSIFNRN